MYAFISTLDLISLYWFMKSYIVALLLFFIKGKIILLFFLQILNILANIDRL